MGRSVKYFRVEIDIQCLQTLGRVHDDRRVSGAYMQALSASRISGGILSAKDGAFRMNTPRSHGTVVNHTASD